MTRVTEARLLFDACEITHEVATSIGRKSTPAPTDCRVTHASFASHCAAARCSYGAVLVLDARWTADVQFGCGVAEEPDVRPASPRSAQSRPMPVILPCRCPLRARCSHAAPRIARCASTHPPLLHPIVLHCKRLSDGAFYEILDSTQQAESGGKYAYSFNVCGDVQKKETKCASTPTQVTTATAYQVSVDEGWCYPVGDSPEAFSVIGSTTKGVKMGLLTHYDSPDDLNRKGTGMTDSTRVRSSSSQCATFC